MILKPSGTNVKLLPLSPVEGFVLSQVDGTLDLDGIAEVTGLDSAEVERVARRLVELGAAIDVSARPAANATSAGTYGRTDVQTDARAEPTGAVSSGAVGRRRDPRAEETIHPPKTPRSVLPPKSPKTVRPPKTMAPPKQKTVRPPKPKTMAPPKAAPPKSVRPAKLDVPPVSTSSSQANVEPAKGGDVDEATLANIAAFEAKLADKNYYQMLGVERDAEKKAIKRAYFALATEYHPDRYFGKKLGTARARIEAIFVRLTDAHDTLTDPDKRRAYDARLPPWKRTTSKKLSRAMKAVKADDAESAPAGAAVGETPKKPPTVRPPRQSVRMKAVASAQQVPASAIAPMQMEPPPVSSARAMPPPALSVPTPMSGPSSVSSAARAGGPVSQPGSNGAVSSASPSSASSASSPTSGASSARGVDLRAGMMAARTQARVDMLVKAGEEALAANDIIGAANNYRLALEHKEDRRLRFIFEDLDARSRSLRFDKNMSAARTAETDGRWADAAVFLMRANDAKADCDVATRAATALRLSGGDMERATALGEQAVQIAPRNPHYRLNLAAVYLTTRNMTRAREECAEARRLAPKDEDIQALAQEIEKKSKIEKT